MQVFASPEENERLTAETERLLDFAEAAVLESGFGWLDDEGRLDADRPQLLWVNARMTHVFALGHLLGRPGADVLSDHGVRALRGPFRDEEHAGWFPAVTSAGPADTSKNAYDHAFVVLAASTATVAGRPGAGDLLDDALQVVERRFWSEDEGACLESWDRVWEVGEDYRGANANMHMTEAFLAAFTATGDGAWRNRALRVAGRVVEAAREFGWRIPEHYDASWRPVLDYHRDEPRHPFRPYGVTPGHGLEWSRLLLDLRAALDRPPAWLGEAAENLFERAMADGWDDARGGLVYTTDFEGTTVVADRFHWVTAEAIAAAATLGAVTGRDEYTVWYRRLWDFAESHLLDRERGSWRHELSPDNRPATRTWRGKPDVYHALQATLVPRFPVAPGVAAAVVAGLPS